MAEGWVATKAGAHLVGRPRYGTEPEMLLRRALHSLGCRYRVQRRLAPGCRPDIMFPGPKVAVFVDGDFWHGCPVHGRKHFNGPNADLWRVKLERNRARDIRASALAEEAGFLVVRIWECAVRQDPGAVAANLRDIVVERTPPRSRRDREEGGSA